MNKTIDQISKESRLENLLALERAICNGSLEELDVPNDEWGGAHVIITSSPEDVFDPESDEDDWLSRRSQDTYVVTKHSKALSKVFWHVKENILDERDFHLYGFMAFLANDFLKEFGDLDDCTLMLEYVASGILFYYKFFYEFDKFQLMRFFLSQNISDEEIKNML